MMQPSAIVKALEPSLWAAIRRGRGFLLYAALFSAGVNALNLIVPIYMLQVYDRVLSSRSLTTLAFLTLAVLFSLLVLAALDDIRSRVLVRLGVRFDRDLSSRILDALLARSIAPNSPRNSQPISDLDSVRQVLTGNTIHALFDAPWIIVYLAVLAMIHPVLGIAATLGAISLLIAATFNEIATRKNLAAATQNQVASAVFADQMVRNAEAITAMGMQRAVARRWNIDRWRMIGNQATASDRAAIFSSLTKFLRLLAQISMLGLGAMLALRQEISSGAIVAAGIIIARALAPVELAVGSWRQLSQGYKSFRRLNDLLKQYPAKRDAMSLPRPEGALSVQAVSMMLPGGDRPIVRGVTFSVAPGELVALVGPSAAGKSTLARLIVGIWKPSAGAIRLDGADIYAWDSEDVGRHIGYLPQDIALFTGTVRENIARFRDADPEEIVLAAQRAGVHAMILGLPQGYETEIGDGGARLSGGQRQRLGLARAIFGRPSLVVLDEPNSNLDQEGEASLMKSLNQMKQEGSTIIVISHRTGILAVADKVAVLREGVLTEFGPPGEVLPKISPRAITPMRAGSAPPTQLPPAAGQGRP